MGVEIFRVDDRLIHGQVVVGWGQPLDVRAIVLVDDEVAASQWEQDLYRMGVPEEMEVSFESVET
ncbi:MAG: PTS sugar transporter subunit IIB, partial [Gemmatimonadetes bacterium]|nr:PTS sugar transporter subunit IIB [Gemmatimonadota bacterium]